MTESLPICRRAPEGKEGRWESEWEGTGNIEADWAAGAAVEEASGAGQSVNLRPGGKPMLERRSSASYWL